MFAAARRALAVFALAALACGEPPAATQARSVTADERNEPYFAGPWPDDRRLIDGLVPTRRFPRPGQGSLLDNLLTTADRVAKGWGLSAPVYLPFSGPLDVSSLPESPARAREADASAFLVAIDRSSPLFARRHPVDFRFLAAPTLYLGGNVLAARPSPGFPLEASTRYALIVTRKVRDAGGQPVGPDAALAAVLAGTTEDAHYAPLLAALDALGLERRDVAGAVLFTTQPVMEELLVLRDFLEAQPSPSLDGARLTDTAATYFVFEGTYQAANLQHGDVPYSLSGGHFRFDDAGKPLVGDVEAMRVAVCTPKGAPPAGGFPVVLYSHGTGGNYRSFIDDVCEELTSVGVAAVGIDQVFHGPRGKGAAGCFGQDIELCFFNPVNAVGGRNSTRQSALDNVLLRKMLTVAVVPASVHPEGHEVRFAAARVGFFGHSQGGLSGALYAAFDEHLAGAVLSGAGGHLTTTVLERTDPIDVRALAAGPLLLGIEGQEELDAFHPALALVQALADVADPASYARHWVQRPYGAPKHLYVTSGMVDPFTPAFTAEVMAAAGGIPQTRPIPRDSAPHLLAGISPIGFPAQDTVGSVGGGRVTAVFRQFAGAGHFPVFYDATAKKQWKAFLEAVVKGRPVVVPLP